MVVIPNISSGKVLVTPTASNERANSSKLKVKPNKPMPIRLGKIIGTIT